MCVCSGGGRPLGTDMLLTERSVRTWEDAYRHDALAGGQLLGSMRARGGAGHPGHLRGVQAGRRSDFPSTADRAPPQREQLGLQGRDLWPWGRAAKPTLPSSPCRPLFSLGANCHQFEVPGEERGEEDAVKSS